MIHRSLAGILLGIFSATFAFSAAQQAAAPAGREVAGKKLFLQRCSVCHLPPLGRAGEPTSFGPDLKSKVKDAASEERIRNFVRRGTSRMPGFQYALNDRQFDDLIAYLKTLR